MKTGKAKGSPSGLIGKGITGLVSALSGGLPDVPVYPVRKSLGGNVEVLINVNAKAQCAGLAGTDIAASFYFESRNFPFTEARESQQRSLRILRSK